MTNYILILFKQSIGRCGYGYITLHGQKGPLWAVTTIVLETHNYLECNCML